MLCRLKVAQLSRPSGDANLPPEGRLKNRSIRERFFKWAVLAILAMASSAPHNVFAAPCTLNLFAAASLTESADALIKAYSAKTGATVCPVYGGSSALARQIEFGAPAAVFLSAHPKWVAYLVGKHRVAPADHAVIAHNQLVLAARKDSDWTVDWADPQAARDILAKKIIALGQLDTVPVGIYAKEALTSLGLLETLRPHLVSGNNVRTIAVWLQRGEVDAAILYATDLRAFRDLREVAAFPSHSHEPIAYEAALIAAHTPKARALYDFIRGPDAADILHAYGFEAAESLTSTN